MGKKGLVKGRNLSPEFALSTNDLINYIIIQNMIGKLTISYVEITYLLEIQIKVKLVLKPSIIVHRIQA